jgi:hypothetical protein
MFAFPDGDVTRGIEIADGKIRLVRWPATTRSLG